MPKDENELFEVEPKNEVVEEAPEVEEAPVEEEKPKKREPKKRAKRVLSEAEKARRLEQLARGRATSLQNRRKAAALKKKEKEEKDAEKDAELKEYLDSKAKKMDVIAENKRLRMELDEMKKRKSKPVEPMASIEEEDDEPTPPPKKVKKVAVKEPPREPTPPPPPKPVKVDTRASIFHGTSYNMKSIKFL